MSNIDIIRAWKDEEYRLRLSDADRAALPPNPAGLIELAEAELEKVAGGAPNFPRTNGGYRCYVTRVHKSSCSIYDPTKITFKGTAGLCTRCSNCS